MGYRFLSWVIVGWVAVTLAPTRVVAAEDAGANTSAFGSKFATTLVPRMEPKTGVAAGANTVDGERCGTGHRECGRHPIFLEQGGNQSIISRDRSSSWSERRSN